MVPRGCPREQGFLRLPGRPASPGRGGPVRRWPRRARRRRRVAQGPVGAAPGSQGPPPGGPRPGHPAPGRAAGRGAGGGVARGLRGGPGERGAGPVGRVDRRGLVAGLVRAVPHGPVLARVPGAVPVPAGDRGHRHRRPAGDRDRPAAGTGQGRTVPDRGHLPRRHRGREGRRDPAGAGSDHRNADRQVSRGRRRDAPSPGDGAHLPGRLRGARERGRAVPGHRPRHHPAPPVRLPRQAGQRRTRVHDRVRPAQPPGHLGAAGPEHDRDRHPRQWEDRVPAEPGVPGRRGRRRRATGPVRLQGHGRLRRDRAGRLRLRRGLRHHRNRPRPAGLPDLHEDGHRPPPQDPDPTQGHRQ